MGVRIFGSVPVRCYHLFIAAIFLSLKSFHAALMPISGLRRTSMHFVQSYSPAVYIQISFCSSIATRKTASEKKGGVIMITHFPY